MRKTKTRLRNRRTKSTFFLSPRHRELIKSSGKTVQKFFEDLVNFYDELKVFNWKKGQFSYNGIRALLVRSDFINALCDALPDPYNTGRQLGEKARQAYTAALGLDPNQIENYLRQTAEKFGWGTFTVQAPNRLFIESPAITSEPFLRGLLESNVGHKLSLLYAEKNLIVFEID